ncbi:tetratricopeptide repeat-containing diguanylate cyclase [Dyella sedimenti]|uniref:tetratricopeptide repeat-containing diguanylate cyclase n=1 Tax=Dyella sedimenti TaxID=2919947 RepID=UPI001FAB1F32|nr:diguanylate cyclase [Dyella sedimenti]
MPTADSPQQLLQHAFNIKTSDHDEFLKVLTQLHQLEDNLPLDEQWTLRYLDAWQAAFEGNETQAIAALRTIADQAPVPALRLRAMATIVNLFGFAHRYEDAFVQLNRLTELLPEVTDKGARYAAMGEAAQFLILSHRYEQAVEYADQMLQDVPEDKNACHAIRYRLQALIRSNAQLTPAQFQQGVALCTDGNDSLFANAVRSDMAAFYLQKGHASEAIRLLDEHYAEVQGYNYLPLMQYFNVLLAEGYFSQGNLAKAHKFALATIEGKEDNAYSEPLSRAYGLLYRIESRLGHDNEALAYHEKYMAADKGYLNDVTAGALAYETIKQQVQANKNQVDTLNRQNQILQLQRQLDRKAMETSRLYIALLLTVLASIAFWLLRIKRSQLRFKRLATRDSLTGIHSRQHFVDEAELALRAAAKAARPACLLLFDLDHFKDVNDTHGHATGDLVLKRAVAACQQHLHRLDIFGRLGGEEFAILLPDCTAALALQRAERIRQAIAATPLWGETRHVVISASFGIASTDRSGYELRQLVIDADNALYRAKRDGRNRVVYEDADGKPAGAATHAGHDQAPERVAALSTYSESTH